MVQETKEATLYKEQKEIQVKEGVYLDTERRVGECTGEYKEHG